jgi:dTDP-glucose 4,6-dehydratase
MSRILLTGAAGFVGAHMLRHLIETTEHHIVAPVSLRHRGSSSRLEWATAGQRDRVTFLRHDLAAPLSATELHQIGDVEAILNVASESHVDRSITDPRPFVENNVSLALTVLEAARALRPDVVLHMSTDEVYGPAEPDQAHAEWSPILPSNPYSASKAAQEAIAISYWRTYGVPLVLTNTMNIFGQTQHPEKFVPRILSALAHRRPITVHGSPDGTFGSRFYLHASQLASAWAFLLARPDLIRQYGDGSSTPARWNVVGAQEVDNLQMVHEVAAAAGIDPALAHNLVCVEDFHTTRPGHDRRYALDGGALAAAGWPQPATFREDLAKTVAFTLEHPMWMAGA